MIPYTYTFSRGGSVARGGRNDQVGDPRINPWLLWRPERPQTPHVLTVAELAECQCPDICDRDHANE
jgi:hypothetical protein